MHMFTISCQGPFFYLIATNLHTYVCHLNFKSHQGSRNEIKIVFMYRAEIKKYKSFLKDNICFVWNQKTFFIDLKM